MGVRASEVTSNNVTDFVDDVLSEEVVDVEKLLPDDAIGDALASELPGATSHRAARRRSHRRELEEYLEHKRLQEWLYDPLDDTSH